MIQANLPVYAGSSILKDDNTKHPGRAEDDPIPAQTYPAVVQAAEAADTLNTDHTHKDIRLQKKPPYRHYNEDSIHKDILEVQMPKRKHQLIHNFTPDTDSEYPVFINDTNHDHSFHLLWCK